eukprot:gene25419-31039_t
MTLLSHGTSWEEMHMDAKVPIGLFKIRHTFSLRINIPQSRQLCFGKSAPKQVQLWSYDAASGVISLTHSKDPSKPAQVFAESECVAVPGGFLSKGKTYCRLSAAPEGEHGNTDAARRTWAFDDSGQMSLRADGRKVHVAEASFNPFNDAEWFICVGITEKNTGQESLRKVAKFALRPFAESESKAPSTVAKVFHYATDAMASVDSALSSACGDNWGPEGRYGWDHTRQFWKCRGCELTNEAKNTVCFSCNIKRSATIK